MIMALNHIENNITQSSALKIIDMRIYRRSKRKSGNQTQQVFLMKSFHMNIPIRIEKQRSGYHYENWNAPTRGRAVKIKNKE